MVIISHELCTLWLPQGALYHSIIMRVSANKAAIVMTAPVLWNESLCKESLKVGVMEFNGTVSCPFIMMTWEILLWLHKQPCPYHVCDLCLPVERPLVDCIHATKGHSKAALLPACHHTSRCLHSLNTLYMNIIPVSRKTVITASVLVRVSIIL